MDGRSASTVMIIEGDPTFGYVLRNYARSSGCRVVAADAGQDPLALAREERPEAIVLEAEAQEVAGWEMLRSLKEDLGTRDIPVLVCSWLDVEARSLAEGASGYLRKPVLYEDLLSALVEAGVYLHAGT